MTGRGRVWLRSEEGHEGWAGRGRVWIGVGEGLLW